MWKWILFKSILCQAMSLLPYMRANGHPDTSVDCLSDVPWLIVLMFELLTTETLPEEVKPFDSFQEQAHTLQMILDTLEQTLRLPMNHITGIGLARLERRPLSDVLQIFSDLIKHCFPVTTKDTSDRGVLQTPDDRRLSLSQFGSPEFGVVSFSQFSTPEMSRVSRDGAIRLPDKQLKMESARQKVPEPSPVMTVRPVPHIGPVRHLTHVRKHPVPEREGRIRNYASDGPVENVNSFQSSKSSTTMVKEVFRQREASNWPKSDNIDIERDGDQVNKHTSYKSPEEHRIFAPRLPSMSLFSPTKSTKKMWHLQHVDKNNSDSNSRNLHISPIGLKSYRYTPYEQPSRPRDLIEYPLTKRAINQSRDQKSSFISSNTAGKPDDRIIKRAPPVQRSLCRKPSVKSFRSPNVSTSRRTSQESSSASSKPRLKGFHSSNTKSVKDVVSDVPNRTKSGLYTSVRSSKEPNLLPNRQRKTSVNNPKLKPPVTGIVKKPPQNLTRKPSVKNKVVNTGPRSGSGNVSSRRPANEFQFSNHGTSCDSRKKDGGSSPIPYEQSSNCRRRPSVVSTKVRKHSLMSPNSPDTAYGRRLCRPVKRGDVSPQTTSLCSSLKLLEEFDFVKRRLRQIQIQKREYKEAIRELEREEVRLEYLLSHVQQQSTRALNKGPSGTASSHGRPV